jgi:hypothetical protein
MATWRYVARDLRTNAALAELPLVDVSFGSVLNGAGSFSATLPLTPRAATSSSSTTAAAALLTGASQPERTALFVERNGVPVWGGIIWSRTRGKGRAAQLQGAELWSFFRVQHLRTTKTYSAIDQLAIARDLINAAEAVTGADIGVATGAETSGVLRDRTYAAFEVKQIGEAVEQLAACDNGFDFAIDPGPAGARTLNLGYPRRGRVFGSTGLAFVDGKNLLDYEVLEDGSRSARVFTALGAGDGTDMRTSTITRTDLIDAGWPLTSSVGSFKDVSVQATLDAHARAGVNARAVTPTFWKVMVDPDDPESGLGQFITGDDVLVEVGDDENFPRQADGTAGFRAPFRILSWQVNVADAGKEQVQVELGGIL